MYNLNSYYSATIEEFLQQSDNEILGIIHSNSASKEIKIQQSNAWKTEIQILKNQLYHLSNGRIIFEYMIPRTKKRIDVVFLYENIVFVLEFKCGDTKYRSSTREQVCGYVLQLQDFQNESFDKLLVPIIVSTKAPAVNFEVRGYDKNEQILEPLRCNADNIADAITAVVAHRNESSFKYIDWEKSEYAPTPTIIESAKAIYNGHNVHDLVYNDAGAKNLTITANEIDRIIEYSKVNNMRSQFVL